MHGLGVGAGGNSCLTLVSPARSAREWHERGDFRTLLPTLLRGEDPAFVKYVSALLAGEAT